MVILGIFSSTILIKFSISKRGGSSDNPNNMQLLTKEQHKAKTKADYKKYGH
jgi:5-methylcytosine-specific restriction endonuclease McrA